MRARADLCCISHYGIFKPGVMSRGGSDLVKPGTVHLYALDNPILTTFYQFNLILLSPQWFYWCHRAKELRTIFNLEDFLKPEELPSAGY